ncbi:MAG: aspartate--tRNA ligase [Defluviitaleaceae bacterium]|nr:aspartate--tRNA ligase [Defluviitaleaceae bacterium]
METTKGLKRSHMCTQIGKQTIGQQVTVMGWVNKRRNLGQLIFIALRDRTGILQIVINGEKTPDLAAKAKDVKSEYVIAVVGDVIARDEKNVNPDAQTGYIEVEAKELRILSVAQLPPFSVLDTGVKEDQRLKYRYIDLRREEMQQNIITRHNITKSVRDFLNKEGFVDIETPMLTKSTPEGARDYLVPSRVHGGSFFALPQSPQIFKQLLMLSGFDRYYQIVKCFRDEDLRSDRQPEFTQLDIELSFVEMEDILSINEQLIAHVYREVKGIDIATPFPRLPYSEAMERYGNDKPDTRFEMELVNISQFVADMDFEPYKNALATGGSVRGINAVGCGTYPRKKIDSLVELAKYHKAKGLSYIIVQSDGYKTSLSKFLTKEQLDVIVNAFNGKTGDIILICADKNSVVFEALSNLRLHIGKEEKLADTNALNFLWVVDFPLLEWDEEANRYFAAHHPFTKPTEEDMALMETDPSKLRSQTYDMILNGVEIGGGSIRINDTALQDRMFKLLGFTQDEIEEKFGFLTNAFKYGAPPHGGIAFGLDRLAMLMVGATSIRDVIAFPKVKDTSCPLTDAPTKVEKEQLNELKINVSE